MNCNRSEADGICTVLTIIQGKCPNFNTKKEGNQRLYIWRAPCAVVVAFDAQFLNDDVTIYSTRNVLLFHPFG